jgi:hypothetical protein
MPLSKEINVIVDALATDIDKNVLRAIIEVETGGKGFADNGKLLIQFEPKWFKREAPYAPSGKWSVNKVDVQSREWEAFNDAYAKNANAAMSATSIGLPQIMGFHWATLGYPSVGAMWDDFKTGLPAQIKALVRFIQTDAKLARAVAQKDWHLIASIYNGAGYAELAARIGREPYNISLRKAYEKYSA